LNRHIQEGWDISSSGLGEYIYCVPAQHKRGTDWYRGTADAIRQNLDLIRGKDEKHILVLCGDHVYKMNYLQMLAYHKKKKADLTISAIKVRREEAANTLGVIEIDTDNRMVGFEEKPAQPKTIPSTTKYVLASMGIYIFTMAAIMEALQAKEHDFGKEILPRIIEKGCNTFIYDYEKENKIEDFVVEVEEGKRKKTLVDRTRDSSYWKDVGTIDSYYEASADLLSVNPLFNLYGETWAFRTYQRPLPPSKCMLGGSIAESIVSDGCIVSGGIVRNSILSMGIVVEKDALVEESIIFDDVTIEPHARVRRAIIDKEVTIQAGATIGYDSEADRGRGCTISDTGIVVVPKGSNIESV
jgi:glucose-1-phosphate adenylyltransferase